MKTIISTLAGMSLALCALTTVRSATILFDDMEYADQAAFEAAWVPIGTTAPLSAELSIEQSFSPTHSAKVAGTATNSQQRNQRVFADTPVLGIGDQLVWNYSFYDSNAAAAPYRQYSNLQDTTAPGSTNQLVSMGLNNNQSSANSGGNFYMARILGYTVPTTPDPDGGPSESVGGSGAYFKLNDFGAGLRPTGWHNLKTVITTDDGNSTDYLFYVDGLLAERVSDVGTAAQIRQYDNIRLGSGLSNAGIAAYFDDERIEFGRATANFGQLYGTDGSGGNLLKIDRTTGISTTIGSMSFQAPALAIDPTTALMYVGQGAGNPFVYRVNPETALTTLVGNTGLGFGAIGDMNFRADGTLFAAVNLVNDGGSGSDHLATINKTTGVATVIGPFGNIVGGMPDLEGIEAIAFSPTGILYGASTTRGLAGPQSSLFIVDQSTGKATFIAPILDAFGNRPSGGITGLQFASDGTLYGGTGTGLGAPDGGFLVTIDPTTGLFSFVGAISATGGRSLAALAMFVPEPSTFVLLCIVFFGANCHRGRR